MNNEMRKHTRIFITTFLIFFIISANISMVVAEENPVEENHVEIPVETVPEFISLGEFKLTAYCPCSICCEGWGENRPIDDNGEIIVYTASGKIAEQGYTISADTDILPFGSKVYINDKEYEVQDRGGAIRNNSIDIYFDDHQAARNFGVQYEEVLIRNSNA